MENKNVLKRGKTFIGLLQIAFIVLKLCAVINWSWWLVMLPTLIIAGIVLLFVLACGVLVLLKVRNDAKIERLKEEAKNKKYF